MNIDNPKLTSFALGELPGKEHASLKKEIAGDLELLNEIAEISKFEGALKGEFRNESTTLRLDHGQRQHLLAQLKPGPPHPFPAFIPIFGVALAASFILAAWVTLKNSRTQRERLSSVATDSERIDSAAISTPPVTISFILNPEEVLASSAASGIKNQATAAPPLEPSIFAKPKRQPTLPKGPSLAKSDASESIPELPAMAKALSNRFADFTENQSPGSYSERKLHIRDGGFVTASDAPLMGLPMIALKDPSLSEFRNALMAGNLPKPDGIRLDELINHFDYRYPKLGSDEEFALAIEIGGCPWADDHLIAKVDASARPRGNRAPGIVAEAAGLQVHFNPTLVAKYRLLGYRNKEGKPSAFLLSGEVLPDQKITFLYEIVPVAASHIPDQQQTERMRLARHAAPQDGSPPSLLHADILFRLPGESSLGRLAAPAGSATQQTASEHTASEDLRFASAVAAFGLYLSGDPNVSSLSLSEIEKLARDSAGENPLKKRREFLEMIAAFMERESSHSEGSISLDPR